jgi:hypothetical protein
MNRRLLRLAMDNIVDPRSLECLHRHLSSMSGGVVGQRRGLGQKSAADHAYEDIFLGNR